MSETSIRISADLSAFESALNKVRDKVDDLSSGLSKQKVDLDSKGAERSLDDLLSLVESLSNAAAKVGSALDAHQASALADELTRAEKAMTALSGVGTGKGGKSAAESLKTQAAAAKSLAAELQKAQRIQELLSREGIARNASGAADITRRYESWRSSGAPGTRPLRNMSFEDLLGGGWRNLALSRTDAQRRYREVLDAVGASGGRSSSGGGGFFSMARGALGATFRAGAGAAGFGGAGSDIASQGLSEAMGAGGGLMSAGGLRLLAGGSLLGLGAAGAIGLIRGIAGKMGDAQNEAMDYSEIRRSSGDLSAGLDELRNTVRNATANLGLSFNDAAKVARSYVEAANGASGLGGTVGFASAYARAAGMNQGQAAGFFGTLHRYGGAAGDDRRLALEIAGAVRQTGSLNDLPKLMASVQQLVAATAQSSLSAPNVAAMLSMIGGMTSTGLPGMTASAAAGAAQQMTSSWQGGGFGASGQNFRLSWLQSMLPDFSALDMPEVNAAGPFATLQSVFGRKSVAYQRAKALGDTGAMARYDKFAAVKGDIGSLEYQSILRQNGSRGSEFAADAVANEMFGGNRVMADAYIAMQKKGGPGGFNLTDILKRAGVSPSSILPGNEALMANIALSGHAGLVSEAGRLRQFTGKNALSSAEGTQLSKALQGGNDDTLRSLLLRLAATRPADVDTAQQSQQAQIDLANTMQGLASKLLPLQTTAKDALVHIAGFFGFTEKGVDVPTSNKDSRGLTRPMYSTPLLPSNWNALSPNKSAAGHVSSGVVAPLPGSGPLYSLGIRNNNPGNLNYVGQPGAVAAGRFAKFATPEAGLYAMANQLGLYGKRGLDSVNSIISTWAPAADHNNTSAYIKDVAAQLHVQPGDALNMHDPRVMSALMHAITRHENANQNPYSDQMYLDAAQRATGSPTQHSVVRHEVAVTLHDQNGRTIPSSSRVTTSVGAPVPAGAHW